MVKIQPMTFGEGVTGRFYEITVPVGASRGDNTNTDKRDIQLVQFFLRTFFRAKPALLPKLANRTGFLIDGMVGNQTIQGIHRFQAEMRKTGTPLFDDSRVSVAKGKFVPGTKAFWTIDALNAFCMVDLGPAQFNNLFSNKEIAAEAPELMVNLVQEEQLIAPF